MTGQQSSLSPPDPAYEGPGHWTPRRRALLEWFNQKAPLLAEGYVGAVNLLHTNNDTCSLRFVCHAFRDLVNLFPECLCDIDKTDRLDYFREVEAISNQWAAAGIHGEDPFGQETGKDLNNEAVPREAFLAVDELIRKHRAVPRFRKERCAIALAAASESESACAAMLMPLADELNQLGKWFQGHAHFPLRDDRVPASRDEVKRKIERFELIGSNVIGRPFKSLGELDGILHAANS